MARGSEADPGVVVCGNSTTACRTLSQDMFLLEGIEAAEGKEGEQHGEPPHAHAHVARPPPHLHLDCALAAATSAPGPGATAAAALPPASTRTPQG